MMPKTKLDPEIPKHRSTKDRKQWCRGKEGVRHAPVWRTRHDWSWIKDRPESQKPMVYACTACGKQLDSWFYWWPPRNQSGPRPPRPVEGSS